MNTSRRLGRSLAAAASLALFGATMLTGPAALAVGVPGSYEARASTATTPATTTQVTVSLTFVNDAPTDSFDFLHHATATFPGGSAPFSGLTGPASVTSSDGTGAVFTVTYSGLTATLDSRLGIPPTRGEVTLDVSVTTPAFPGVYPIATSASGTVGDQAGGSSYSQVGDAPTVTVGPMAGTTYCYNGAVCDTSLIGSERNTLARIVTTGGGNDAVTLSLAPPAYNCANGQVQGKQATYTTQNLQRTVTGSLELDKSIVNSKPDNGAAHYAICYQSKTPFSQASGQPAVAYGSFFYGQLASCATTSNTAPCLLKLTKTGSGDMLATYLGQAGDPGGVWQLIDSTTSGGPISS